MSHNVVVVALTAVLLAVAAFLVKGTRRQRTVAVCSALGAAGAPWLMTAEASLLRGGLAVWATWGLGRVIDLASESFDRPLRERLWHIFGLVDTRQAGFAAPVLDTQALGKTVFYTMLTITGLLIVRESSSRVEGVEYWLLRWLGGALFFYGLADAVEGVVRLLYRAGGIIVARQHVLPIVARSVQEFWGKRWNRAVSLWLRTHCFLPFARRGQVQRGRLAAFAASAVFHGYFTWVAVGPVMALLMILFFLLQGGFVLLEVQMGVPRWSATLAHAWTVIAVLGFSPLFVEPILRIIVGAPH